MRARALAITGLLALIALPLTARADGGTVLLREERGPVIVTLLAGPAPLRAGPVELEVLVQASATGSPVLDANATLKLTGPGSAAPIEVRARSGEGGNRLFLGARVELAEAGPWTVELVVDHPERSAHEGIEREAFEDTFRASLDLASPRDPAWRYWPAIAAGPLGLALLAIHQVLALRRTRDARSRGVGRVAPSREDQVARPGARATPPES